MRPAIPSEFPMFRHARVAFAAATVLVAGSSVLYSCTTAKVETATPESKRAINAHAEQMLNDGREIFRFFTFDDEAFWVKTRLQDAIAGEKNGGVGPGLKTNYRLKV